MAAECLEHFRGSTLLHAGELFGDTPMMDKAPWGRTSSQQFQERLFSEFKARPTPQLACLQMRAQLQCMPGALAEAATGAADAGHGRPHACSSRSQTHKKMSQTGRCCELSDTALSRGWNEDTLIAPVAHPPPLPLHLCSPHTTLSTVYCGLSALCRSAASGPGRLATSGRLQPLQWSRTGAS